MKKNYLLVFIILPMFAFSQFDVNTVEVTTNDLVYDSNTDRIYVSIPSSNGANGNSIGVINPNNNTLENTVFIGSEPTALAISAGVRLNAIMQLARGSILSSERIWVLFVRSSMLASGFSLKKGRNNSANRVTGSKARLSQS